MTKRAFRAALAILFFPLACALCCLWAAPVAARQQTPPQEPPADAQDDETITIKSELIQAGVVVLDKQGRFVDGLKAEDFEVRVDGTPVAVSFFERVVVEPSSAAGAGARRGPAAPAAPAAAQPGRTFLFFIDDLHLSADSHKRARDLVRHFVENEMGPDDRAAVVSPSGKLGFLQQFTDQSEVLSAAAERLRFSRDMSATDWSPPSMTEYEAALVDRWDPHVTDTFVAIYIRMGLATNRESAEMQVRTRARNVLKRAEGVSLRTVVTLEQALRRTAALPGRKIVFFVSDGFFLDPSNTDLPHRLRRVVDAAARSNAVIHTLDPKGISDHMPTGTAGTLSNRSGELWEQQDALSAFAEGTGGRFVRNTNDMRPAAARAAAESSAYYLLAWRPEPGGGDPQKFRRIAVQVRGRPDLSVRAQGGFLDAPKEAAPARAAEAAGKAAPAAPDPLREALGSQVQSRALPTALAADYVEVPGEGPVINAAVRVGGQAIRMTPEGDRLAGTVELAGVVFDAQGKQQGGFRERLTVSGGAKAEGGAATGADPAAAPDLFYNFRVAVKPGFYQVRVAARDQKGGLVGSASRWVEVADTSSKRLALSSLLVGERNPEARAPAPQTPEAAAIPEATLSVDKRFARDSLLRYLVYVYNAGGGRPGGAPAGVAVRTRIFRGGRVVLDGPERVVSAEGQDPARLAYAAEIPLRGLAPGRYVLEVTASDRATKGGPSRRVTFEIK